MLSEILLLYSSLNITVCDTEECRRVANLILSGMNTTVDPCENFYEYVCGSWSSLHPVSDKFSIFSIDTEIEDEIEISLREILEESLSDNDSIALTMEKEWYKACMDKERIRKKGYMPISKFFEDIGGWPMIMNSTEWNEVEFPWQKVAQYYATITGKYSLFTIDQFLNPNNTEVKIIMLDQLDGVQLKWSYDIEEEYGEVETVYYYDDNYDNNYDNDYDNDYNDNEEEELVKVEIFINLITDYAKSVGGNVENISQQVKEILEFERTLHNLTFQIRNDESSKEQHIMTIDEFQKFYDSHEPGNSTAKINWLSMIRLLLNNSGTDIDGSEKLLIFRRSYFEKLILVLKETTDRTIVNYIHWLFFKDALIYFENDKKPWYMDIENYMDRWEYCIDHMNGIHFNAGISQVFVENYFPDYLKESATKMAEEIRNQVELDMSTSSWLEDDAKTLVKEKLKSMKFHIGYPDFYKNKTFFNHVYDGFKVGPDYFENVINILAYNEKEFWKEFREPFDKDQFLVAPTVLNAFYNELDNSLTVPAAELLVPLFNSSLPVSLNYGYLGFTIGHEITHGFDNDGRKFDKDGNKLPWWTEKLIDKYENNTKCFIDQFDNYGINGILTQNENIADSAGLMSAFEAYKKKMEKGNYNNTRLPGLEGLNGEQLFFVSFAASLCTSATPEMIEYWIKRNEHSVEPYRVNGAVSNMKEFSRAFECSKNSPMNPDNKCFLWK